MFFICSVKVIPKMSSVQTDLYINTTDMINDRTLSSTLNKHQIPQIDFSLSGYDTVGMQTRLRNTCSRNLAH